jgi:hypothetical protein
MIFEGIYRSFQALRAGKGNLDARFCFDESLAVSQSQSDGGEMTRAGRRFVWAPNNGIAGLSPVQSLPTTAAAWVLWNADPLKSYWIESLGALLTSGTGGAGAVLLAALIRAPEQVGASQASMLIANASNGGQRSQAIFKQNVTITDPASGSVVWWPYAINGSPNTAVLSVAAYNPDIRSRLIIPPRQGLAMQVVSPVGTAAQWAPFGSHYELETNLE